MIFLSRVNLQIPEKLRAQVEKIICLVKENKSFEVVFKLKYICTGLAVYFLTRYDLNKLISAIFFLNEPYLEKM